MIIGMSKSYMGQIETEEGELALIQRAATGDHEAFCSLVVSYESRLLAYLTQMLGDIDNARDIAQETFIAAFHALPRWQPLIKSSKQTPKDVTEEVQNALQDMQIIQHTQHTQPASSLLAPWLYRIATNRALSLIRKQQVRRRVHGLRETSESSWLGESRRPEDLGTMVSLHNPIEERYIARELLQQALSQLSEDDAACLVLHYVSGERYHEIAARLNLSSEAVRKRISRALVVLRKVYFALDTEMRS